MLQKCMRHALPCCAISDATRMRARPMPRQPNSPRRLTGPTRARRLHIKVADLWNFPPVPPVWRDSQKDIPMNHATSRGTAPRLATPTDLGANAAKDIAGALNAILADSFALY